MPGALAWRLVSNVRAGLVITGTELLSGLITDRNGPWLAQQLGELGVEVAHLICAGDRPADLAAALRFLADLGVDLIVTSGGLGPTADDLTAEVVAGFAGVALELDEAMEQQIAAILARFRHLSAFDAEGKPTSIFSPIGVTVVSQGEHFAIGATMTRLRPLLFLPLLAIGACQTQNGRPPRSTAQVTRVSSIGRIACPYRRIPARSPSARSIAWPRQIPTSSVVWCASTCRSPWQATARSISACRA